jgi:beta-galactosidase
MVHLIFADWQLPCQRHGHRENYQGESLGPSISHLEQPIRGGAQFAGHVQHIFSVTSAISASAGNGPGGNSTSMHVSACELSGVPAFGMSPDQVFEQQDKDPFAAGEFVWSGWDDLGEPTPYESARCSYYRIIDLAGFKKDRSYLYLSRWRSDLITCYFRLWT